MRSNVTHTRLEQHFGKSFGETGVCLRVCVCLFVFLEFHWMISGNKLRFPYDIFLFSLHYQNGKCQFEFLTLLIKLNERDCGRMIVFSTATTETGYNESFCSYFNQNIPITQSYQISEAVLTNGHAWLLSWMNYMLSAYHPRQQLYAVHYWLL